MIGHKGRAKINQGNNKLCKLVNKQPIYLNWGIMKRISNM
jgi:hypothetical protein